MSNLSGLWREEVAFITALIVAYILRYKRGLRLLLIFVENE